MHASTAPLVHAGRRWYVQFATSDRLVMRMRESFSLPALEQGIAAICAIFFVIFLITIHATLRRALEPLRVASEAARGITPRTLAARLDAASQPIEIKPLVEGFNQALDRLQHGFRTQQEFLSRAAHELKTPLALIRAQVERIAVDDRSRLLLQDVDHVARQVQQLLLLAEVSELQNFRIEAIDPRSSIQEVFDYMTRVAEKHAVYLGLQASPSLRQWQVDRGALFTLLKNLLENAIQHSPEGGIVRLSAGADGLSVQDQGPGIPAEHLPLMFDRFWRGSARREEGAGLGLAICREIAFAHGWRLQARNHQGGLEVSAQMDAPAKPPAGA
jgi:signal transduction histidine kinase